VRLMETEREKEQSSLYDNTVLVLNMLKTQYLLSDHGVFHMNLPWIMARKALGDVYLPEVDGISVSR